LAQRSLNPIITLDLLSQDSETVAQYPTCLKNKFDNVFFIMDKETVISDSTTAVISGSVEQAVFIVQGVEDADRYGSVATITQIDLSYLFSPIAVSGVTNITVSLVYDRTPQSVVPAITDIYVTAAPHGLLTYPLVDRFEELYSKSHVTSYGTDYMIWSNPTSVSIPCDIVAEYNSNLGNLADLISGAIYLVIRTDNTSKVDVYYNVRAFFYSGVDRVVE